MARVFSDNDLNALIEVWGAETLYLADSGERFEGNAYIDIVVGGISSDFIAGELGSDLIRGGFGDDELRGGRNADEVRGGAGNDRMFGGQGHDYLNGGLGDDVIRGGFGSDKFQISPGNDLIEDFKLEENDRILLSREFVYTMKQSGNDFKIITSLGVSTFWNIDKHDIVNPELIDLV